MDWLRDLSEIEVRDLSEIEVSEHKKFRVPPWKSNTS
jgi:hypothetical protein